MSFVVPFVDDSFWPFTRRDFDVFDLDPWAHRRHVTSPLASLVHLANEVNNIQHQMDRHCTGVVDKGQYRLAVDVHGYKPDELSVSVDGRTLTMTGKHEEKSQDGKHFVSRQFTRSFVVPDQVDIDNLQSSLASDGRVLKVEAPLRPEAIEAAKRTQEPPRETPIPVQFKGQKAIQK